MSKAQYQVYLERERLYRQQAGIQPKVEPTTDEARNGWTTETLTAYLNSQNAAAQQKINPNSKFRQMQRRPTRANGIWNGMYRPLRWRG